MTAFLASLHGVWLQKGGQKWQVRVVGSGFDPMFVVLVFIVCFARQWRGGAGGSAVNCRLGVRGVCVGPVYCDVGFRVGGGFALRAPCFPGKTHSVGLRRWKFETTQNENPNE